MIGFIGLGQMGLPMARRLAEAGFPIAVHDSDAARMAELASAHLASSAAELVAQADTVITMLPSSAIVRCVLEPALPGLRPGALLLEMSSGDPTTTQALARDVAAAGGTLLDAPVSGGVPRARDGSLAIMVGGEAEAVARAKPVLRALGSSIVHTGAVGSAHAMKALNNLVSAAGFLAGIEALLIGARFGLAPEMMVQVLNSSTGMNNSTQKKFAQFVLSRRFDAGFGLDLMVKDVAIALDVARQTGTPAPFSALCREMWASGRAMLGPGQDHTAMARFSEALAATTLRETRTEGSVQ